MQPLENAVKESCVGMLVYQFKEWRRERAHFDDYFSNCMRILMGQKPIDYRVISHNNLLVKSFIIGRDDRNGELSSNNLLVNSKIYDRETGQYR